MKKYFLAVVTLFTITLATNCKKDEEKKEEPPLKPTPVEEYQVSKDGITLTKWVGSQTATVVDLTQNEALKQITKVGDDAFKGQQNITEITLPSTVKSIGKRAFYGCKDLKNITFAKKANATGRTPLMSRDSTVVEIPTTIEEVGEEAFAQCTSLYAITLPEGLHTIAKGLFKGCFSLTTVNYPLSVYTIEDEAFYGCTNLHPFVLESVTTVGRSAFEYCKIDGLTLHKNTTVVGSRAFANTKITSLTFLEEGITTVNDSLFFNAKFTKGGTHTITLPTGVTTIGASAFENCNVTNVPIPNGVTVIGERAFANSEVAIVTLPEGLTDINSSVFENCKHLKTVSIGDKISSIAGNVFEGCTELRAVTIATTNPPIIRGEGLFSTASKLTDIFVPAGTVDAYKRAEGWQNYAHLIKTIGGDSEEILIRDGVLINYPCKKIPADGHLILPNTITAIGNSAINECTSLKSVVIPNSVTKMGAGVFEGSTALSSVTIPNTVTEIGAVTFENCISLKTIHLPASVRHLGVATFFKCSALTTVELDATTPPTVESGDDGVIFSRSGIQEIIVPDASVSAYKTALGWRKYADKIRGKSGNNNNDSESNDTSVPQGVIIENGVLVKWPETLIPNDGHVKVPYGVKTIGKGYIPAFLATAMENFNPSQGGAPIGNGTLLKVTLPKTVTRIEAMGFAHCYRMHTLIMSDIEEIGTNAFTACMALKKIVIPSWIKVLKALPQPDGNSVGESIMIVCKSATPIPVRNLNSTMIRSEHKLLVPKGSKRAYQQADFWKDFPVIEEEK